LPRGCHSHHARFDKNTGVIISYQQVICFEEAAFVRNSQNIRNERKQMTSLSEYGGVGLLAHYQWRRFVNTDRGAACVTETMLIASRTARTGQKGGNEK